jgi:hypothetical protein
MSTLRFFQCASSVAGMITPAALPPLQAAWLDQFLGGPIPAEKNATCDTCAMFVDRTDDSPSALPGFNPETKCCTYLPRLWNFLVGGILDDEHADAAKGRATIEARIDRGAAVTPLGLGRTRLFDTLYRTGRELTFGQSRDMRCPHYLHEEGGLCGVWRHRESTCSTWFCKHVRGAVGLDFWSHLHQLLRSAERSLAAWTLLELGIDTTALAFLYEPRRDLDMDKLTGRDVDGVPNPEDVRAAWGQWLGRERQLYRECAKLVAPLAWADVMRIGGAELGVYARLVESAYARLMSEAIPERPTAALVQITPRGKGRARLATYSGADVLDVPAEVGTILPYFNGRPTNVVLDDIRATTGVSVAPSLVRKLTDFGVLREANAAAPT